MAPHLGTNHCLHFHQRVRSEMHRKPHRMSLTLALFALIHPCGSYSSPTWRVRLTQSLSDMSMRRPSSLSLKGAAEDCHRSPLHLSSQTLEPTVVHRQAPSDPTNNLSFTCTDMDEDGTAVLCISPPNSSALSINVVEAGGAICEHRSFGCSPDEQPSRSSSYRSINPKQRRKVLKERSKMLLKALLSAPTPYPKGSSGRNIVDREYYEMRPAETGIAVWLP
jgi:hypothetical protein